MDVLEELFELPPYDTDLLLSPAECFLDFAGAFAKFLSKQEDLARVARLLRNDAFRDFLAMDEVDRERGNANERSADPHDEREQHSGSLT